MSLYCFPFSKSLPMHPMLNTAVKAAREAAEIIQYGARNLDRLTVDSKGLAILSARLTTAMRKRRL